jgi:hypothetical protein
MMKALNLADRHSVFQNAATIYDADLSGAMPPSSGGEARWSSDMCQPFKGWWDQGGPR